MASAYHRLRVLERHVLSRSASSVPGVTNRTVLLRANPKGEPVQSDYEVVTAQLRGIEEGEMLLMTKFLSLDPYMRSEFMNLERSLGKKIIGGTVSEVVESKCRGWEIGDLVVGAYGWTEFAIGKASDMQSRGLPIQKWDRTLGAPSLGIGALGMTGFTAFHGLLNKTNPMKGETVVVSSASGAVGQVVAQLAKIRGCKVVGIAGGPAKCAFCVDELGVDACIDYKDAANFRANLAAAVPGGIDIYFENVGGEILEAVLPLLNSGCRVPVCGFISQYNVDGFAKKKEGNPMVRLKELGMPILGKDGSTEGFCFFYAGELSTKQPDALDALRAMSGWMKEGKLKHRESITHGIESCVPAFIGMLAGRNFGKTVVQF